MTGIVIAWHTPDDRYANLANDFSRRLSAIGQPHRFYVVDNHRNEPWAQLIMRTKTSLWRRAIADYPGAPLMFLDVDCIVNGPLDGAFAFASNCDVAFAFFMKPRSFYCSTRVFILNPRPAAYHFMARWQDLSSSGLHGTEEGSLCGVLSTQNTAARIKALPPHFAGIEHGKAPTNAIITHASAHKHALPLWKRAEHGARAAYRALIPKRRAAFNLEDDT